MDRPIKYEIWINGVKKHVTEYFPEGATEIIAGKLETLESQFKQKYNEYERFTFYDILNL